MMLEMICFPIGMIEEVENVFFGEVNDELLDISQS